MLPVSYGDGNHFLKNGKAGYGSALLKSNKRTEPLSSVAKTDCLPPPCGMHAPWPRPAGASRISLCPTNSHRAFPLPFRTITLAHPFMAPSLSITQKDRSDNSGTVLERTECLLKWINRRPAPAPGECIQLWGSLFWLFAPAFLPPRWFRPPRRDRDPCR